MPADAAWRALRADVEGATRKSDLGRAEDEVDAVVCAYVACSPTGGPTGSRRTATSSRVTSSRRPCTDAHAAIARPSRSTPSGSPAWSRWPNESVGRSTSLLDEAGVNYLSVTGRAKTVGIVRGQGGPAVDGPPAYHDPLREITDQVGIRVITYVRSDVATVADVLATS